LISYGDHVLPDVATQTRWMELPLSEQMTKAPDQPIVPHPRLQDRAFVLGPLMDIAPQWRHPVLGRTIAEIYAATPQNLKDEVKPL